MAPLKQFDKLVQRAGDPGSSILAVPGTDEPSMRDLFSPPTFRAGQFAYYIDAYNRLRRCTVTRDEGEHGRVYVRLGRGGEVWFDRHERDRLMMRTSEANPA